MNGNKYLDISTIVALIIIVFTFGIILTVILTDYDVDKILKIWAGLGTSLAPIASFFFNKEMTKNMQSSVDNANKRAEIYAMKVDPNQSEEVMMMINDK